MLKLAKYDLSSPWNLHLVLRSGSSFVRLVAEGHTSVSSLYYLQV